MPIVKTLVKGTIYPACSLCESELSFPHIVLPEPDDDAVICAECCQRIRDDVLEIVGQCDEHP